MKLHRVRLLNYRGVIESDVCFSESGVTIVEGPNEVGKSSIPEALGLAIELPDSSQKAQVKSIKPVDRDEGPEVEVTLSSGQYHLIYGKRWLRNAQTTLRVLSPHNESRTGREAHDRLREILDETLDESLWRALRIEQGMQASLPSFTMPSMRAALDRVAGGDLGSGDEDTLWERIKTEYVRHWTPSGQKNGQRKSSERRVEKARERVGDLKNLIDDVEKDILRMARLVEEAVSLSATRDECEMTEHNLVERWNSVVRMRSEIDRHEAILSAAEAKRDRAVSDRTRRQDLIDALGVRATELTALEADSRQSAPELSAATCHRDCAADALKDAKVALRSAEAKRGRAVQDRDFLRQQIEVEQLSERYDRYVEAVQNLTEAEAYLETARVDDDVLELIESAYWTDVRAGAAASSAAASVELTGLGNTTMQVSGQDVQLNVDKVIRAIVEDEVEIVIPGVVRMRVSAGAESRELSEQHRGTREEFERVCTEFGVANLDDARKAAQARRDAQRNRTEATKAIERDLRDLTPEVLKAKINSLSTRVSSYPQVRPEDPPLPPDFETAQKGASEQEGFVAECQAGLETCEQVLQRAESELARVRLNEVDLTARMEVARASKEDALSRLVVARDSQADEVLTAALVIAQDQFNDALKSFEDAQAQLSAEDPDTLEILLKNARDAKRRAVQSLESNSTSQNELRASLNLRGERGLQGLYDHARGEMEQVEREHELNEARAEAARLLRATFETRRRQAHQRYIEPFKQRIDQLGRIVFGPTFEVELDDELRVVCRTLADTNLSVEQLSTGAREQLGVLSRLACAAIVSPTDGGVPVMIDDALGWTDPQRLQGMGAAIAAAGRQCQVIVLTCTPGRYSHIGSAKVVALGV